MIAENTSNQLTITVVSTIATERDGISDLLKAIEIHQLAMQDGVQKKEMYFNKMMQLIMASKMNQVDVEKVKASLVNECNKANFNVFKFAQTFY